MKIIFTLFMLISLILVGHAEAASKSTCAAGQNFCSAHTAKMRLSQQNTCCCMTYNNVQCCGACSGTGVFGCLCKR
jgi:hypothetical protein